MADSSFDIVSEVNIPELNNAVDQTKKEIATRFDFKNSKADVVIGKEDLTLTADDEGKMNQLKDVLHSKLAKRGISLKGLKYGKLENAVGQTVRLKATLVQGLDADTCRIIHKKIKDSKIKVSAQTMDQKIRVTGKSKDDLQQIMQMLKADEQITIALQFTNYK